MAQSSGNSCSVTRELGVTPSTRPERTPVLLPLGLHTHGSQFYPRMLLSFVS